jgi:hypothetical protein
MEAEQMSENDITIEAEREVIAQLGQAPDQWQQVAMFLAADRLLALDLLEVRHNSEGAWEYRLSAAGRRVAQYLTAGDRLYRNHPQSNYNGGIIETSGSDRVTRVIVHGEERDGSWSA